MESGSELIYCSKSTFLTLIETQLTFVVVKELYPLGYSR